MSSDNNQIGERRYCVCGDEVHSLAACDGVPRCWECWEELVLGIIDPTPAKLYSAGRDRKLEPSPWGENNVRELEDAISGGWRAELKDDF